MANKLAFAFINILALKAIAHEADFTFAISPTLSVGTQGIGVAAPIVFFAIVNVLAFGAIPKISTETDTAVAAQVVVAAGFKMAAMQTSFTLIDVTAI